MNQNYLSLDGTMSKPLKTPFDFQVGYARETTNEPLYLGIQRDPIAPATPKKSYTLSKTHTYALIGAGIGLVYLMTRPTRYY